MDLLHNFIQSKIISYRSHTEDNGKLQPRISDILSHLFEKATTKPNSVRWLHRIVISSICL